MTIKPWIVLDSRKLFSNRWLTLRVDKCEVPDDNHIIDDFYVVERPDSVHVVPVTKDRKVALVKQYRHACGQVIYELPAGYTKRGESPIEAAERELQEETGYIAKRTDLLTLLYYSPAVLTNKAYIFLCRDLEQKVHTSWDETEKMETVYFDIDELVYIGINDNIIVDSITVSGLLMAHQYLR
jgi:ADP-ribose pyrophosphatase